MRSPNRSVPDIDFRHLRTFLALARVGNRDVRLLETGEAASRAE
jgi:hypothetical protein